MARRKSVRSKQAAAYNASAFPSGSPGSEIHPDKLRHGLRPGRKAALAPAASEITQDQLRTGESKQHRRSVLDTPEGGEEVKPMGRKNSPGSNPQKPKPKPAPSPKK